MNDAGLTPKQAWWAGARAALGFHASVPRSIVAMHLPDVLTLPVAISPPVDLVSPIALGNVSQREDEDHKDQQSQHGEL